MRAEEKTETVVKQFCADKLSLDASSMAFGRDHRVGGESAKTPRPTVPKFHYYQERETVRQNRVECSVQVKTQKNKESVYNGQNPLEIPEQINLYSPMKREKDLGETVEFVGDKLFINGREYLGDGSTST